MSPVPHFLHAPGIFAMLTTQAAHGHFFTSAGLSRHPTSSHSKASVNAPSFEGTGHPKHGIPFAELNAGEVCFCWTRPLPQTMRSSLGVFFSIVTMPQLVRHSDIEAGNNLLVKEHHLPECQEGNERFGNERLADVL